MDQKSTSERLAQALERARHHWQREKVPEVPAAPPVPPFTIALSREAGTNGSEIARAVGKKLNWPVYDREVLEQIAGEMGLRVNLLESVEQKRESWFQECLQALSSSPSFNERTYARHLVQTLLSLAAHGECVIVGRGAAQILPMATTLRVRLVAPLKDRIASVRQRLSISHEEAERLVEKRDRDRLRFVKDLFQKDLTDPRSYDVILNTSRYAVDESAELIVAALHQLQARAAKIGSTSA
jgi:cytidylate kinase